MALSGSLPPGAPSDGFGRLAGLARAAVPAFMRAPVPASRPTAVLADTYGPALAAVLVQGPAVVKINAAEAADATGIAVDDPASGEAAAALLIERGAGAVVITLGPDGAVVVTPTGANRLPSPGIRGAYPVGSGDAFLGGLAVGIGRGDGVVDAARLGLAAGAANALIPGAGELDPLEVDRMLGEMPRS
jgi:fructose-1-phosphate kinase PfkB-like protein